MFVRGVFLVVAVGVAISCPVRSFGQPSHSESVARELSEAVATVNGTTITEEEVQSAGSLPLARITQQFYAARAETIDRIIAKRLMEAEAGRRGLSPAEYERMEINAKVRPVSDGDVEEIFVGNKQRVRGDETEARLSIRTYLEQVRRTVRRASLVAELRAASEVQLLATSPPPFRVQVDIDGAPVRGSGAAPVTVVEFSDFHCPFCRRVQPTLASVLAKYGERVRVAYKHFPLDGLHPNARKVSVAAWCAGAQGRFWEFHDAVYAGTSTDATDTVLAAHASTAGLDAQQFATCLKTPEAERAVQRDVAEGEALGVSSTPAFFVNGREVHGAQPVEVFERIINEELTLHAVPDNRTLGMSRVRKDER
jgi:protein-disulfide isomerase